jgi:chorismate dehydratase
MEERQNFLERTGEDLNYLDLAEEWRALTGLAFVSAVWGAAHGTAAPGGLLEEGINEGRPRSAGGRGLLDERIAEDFIRSRDHGLANLDALVAEWSRRMPIPESTIRSYLTTNIHYVLDEECVEGMAGFFRMAAEYGILPPYAVTVEPWSVIGCR